MKELYYKIGAGISMLGASLVPFAASAQLGSAGESLSEVGTEIGASDQDLPELVGGLINILLSLLGIIFVVLLVYAGFLYTTAAGNDSQVTKAKDIMKTSIIGLVIVVSAFAISTFIIGALVDVGTGQA